MPLELACGKGAGSAITPNTELRWVCVSFSPRHARVARSATPSVHFISCNSTHFPPTCIDKCCKCCPNCEDELFRKYLQFLTENECWKPHYLLFTLWTEVLRHVRRDPGSVWVDLATYPGTTEAFDPESRAILLLKNYQRFLTNIRFESKISSNTTVKIQKFLLLTMLQDYGHFDVSKCKPTYKTFFQRISGEVKCFFRIFHKDVAASWKKSNRNQHNWTRLKKFTNETYLGNYLSETRSKIYPHGFVVENLWIRRQNLTNTK